MTLATILLGLWALLLAGKGTPVGRWLERWMVAKPAAALSGIRRNTVLVAATLVLVALLCWWVIGHEGMVMYGMALPELGAALAAIDLGVILDIAVVVVGGAAAGAWQVLRTLVRPHAASRTRRARWTRTARRPAANDDDGPARAAA
ncbi:MAG: hypothetical protein J7500_18580 [Sphingomonas sp.]|uniref:hypothetical protein n=1 Tax=Sphingomonas sp. TaxID=28214 RepID=UPI001B0F4DB9|nr:hypothetical protein [Sphingomonas sp.]MBO9624718.1 hypothetical protein [Sphingomonas sp.]